MARKAETKGSLSVMMMILLILLRPPKDQQFPPVELLALEEILGLEGAAANAKGLTLYHSQTTAKSMAPAAKEKGDEEALEQRLTAVIEKRLGGLEQNQLAIMTMLQQALGRPQLQQEGEGD